MPSVQSCTLQRVQPNTTLDEKNRGHYTLKYDVVTDGIMGHGAVTDGALTSSPHALPSWGQTYSYQGDTDATAFAQRYEIESVPEVQSRYVITVNFDPIEGDVNQFDPNPTERPAIVWADKETFTQFIYKDAEDKAILNKCGRPYIDGYEEEDTHGVIVVEFNVLTLAEVIQYQRFLRRATNSTDWTFLGVTIPARTAIARDVSSGQPITEGAYTYYRLSIRFVFADDGEKWDKKFLEQGVQYFTKNGAGAFVLDADGNKKLSPPGGEPEPVRLDAEGLKLADGADDVFTDWRIRREVNFNTLPFSG